MLFGDSILTPRANTYYDGGNNGLGFIDTPVGKVEPPSNNSGGTSVGESTSPKRVEPSAPIEPAPEPSNWGVSNTGDGEAVATSPKRVEPSSPVEPTNWGEGAVSEGSREPERPPLSEELIDKIVNRPIEPTTGYVQSDGTVGYEPEKPGDKEIKEAAAFDRIKTAALAEEDRRKREYGIKDSDTNENKATKEPVRISENNDNNAFAASQINTGINRTPEQVVMSSAGGGARANRSTLANRAVFGGMSNSAHPGYSLFGGV